MIRKFICIVDLEATCWEEKYTAGPDGSGYVEKKNEIIEIGAVAVDSLTLKTVAEFRCFVKPKLNPELSDFCKRLTSIRQEDVDSAMAFPEAVAAFSDWLRGCVGPIGDVTFASWGKYDDTQLREDCELHMVQFPFTGEHFNVKTQYLVKTDNKRGGQGRAARSLGLKWEGTAHRALDDARMAAKVLAKVGL